MVHRRYKVSAAASLAVIALPGLLVCGPMATPPPLAPPVELNLVTHQSEGHSRANCRVVRPELRFEWLRMGDEPAMHATGNAPVCLAVYRMDVAPSH